MSSGLESVPLVKCLLLAGMPTHLWLVIKQEVPPGRNPLLLSEAGLSDRPPSMAELEQKVPHSVLQASQPHLAAGS